MSLFPTVVGMVHLSPLPGAPGFAGSMQAVVEDALGRSRLLVDAGFPALMVENFGDAPFYADAVPAETVAAVTRCVAAITSELSVPIGVNVLRNDARAAVAVAAATGASAIRVNVLTGMMHTDQGPVVGRAAEVIRMASRLTPELEVWADVFVKHASPPAGLTLEQSALDTWERGGANALILSGSGTGHAPELDRFRRVAKVVPNAPLIVGSGVTSENLPSFLEVADRVIVGTALEVDGRPGAELDPARVDGFVAAAASAGVV